MNKEIKLRKRRFWAICFVIVFAMIQLIPSSVLAATYSCNGFYLTPDTTVLYPGDVINYDYNPIHADPASIYYCDADAAKSQITSDSYSHSDASAQSFTVKDYTGTALSAGEFKEWKVDKIYGSSGSLEYIRLVAVGYTRSTINYELDGGTNAESNPDGYYEGKAEVVLADAEKEGCTFEGWYNDADFTTRVTSIPITQTGSITLYAKFTANNYNIFYELDGGSNGAGNPDSYTYGIGVASFADAEKEGYTFEGWYADAEFTTQITSIDATQIRDVTLHAKFVEDEEETTSDNSNNNQNDNNNSDSSHDKPSSGTDKKDDVPKTGDNTPIVWLFILSILSGTGLIITVEKRRENLNS